LLNFPIRIPGKSGSWLSGSPSLLESLKMAKVFGLFFLLLIGCSSWFSVVLAASAGEQELLRYTQTHDMIAPDGIPMLQVFDSGRVLVHRPAYMKQAGDYEYFLGAAEMKTLRDHIERRSITAFNKAALTERLRRADAANQAGRRQLFSISDNTYTNLSIYPGMNGAVSDIRWANLQIDADRHPELQDLTEIAETERFLQKLLQHSQMKKLD
jgi:hypothetical protein